MNRRELLGAAMAASVAPSVLRRFRPRDDTPELTRRLVAGEWVRGENFVLRSTLVLPRKARMTECYLEAPRSLALMVDAADFAHGPSGNFSYNVLRVTEGR